LIDGINNDYIAPEKIEAPGCPKRFVLIVKRRQQYKVKVKIASGAWEPEVNSYRWYHVELLIDGQHIRRWFIPKPPDGGNVEHTFDADPLGRPFFFDTRHDGSNGPKDQVEDSDEVGQICVRFRRAKTFSLAEREFSRRKRPRRNHDFHKDNKFNLREAQKKRMDLDTKLKKSTMRTIFGDSNDSYHHHPRNRRSGGLPPAKVTSREKDFEKIVFFCVRSLMKKTLSLSVPQCTTALRLLSGGTGLAPLYKPNSESITLIEIGLWRNMHTMKIETLITVFAT